MRNMKTGDTGLQGLRGSGGCACDQPRLLPPPSSAEGVLEPSHWMGITIFLAGLLLVFWGCSPPGLFWCRPLGLQLHLYSFVYVSTCLDKSEKMSCRLITAFNQLFIEARPFQGVDLLLT